jgi:hypothetical protein
MVCEVVFLQRDLGSEKEARFNVLVQTESHHCLLCVLTPDPKYLSLSTVVQFTVVLSPF